MPNEQKKVNDPKDSVGEISFLRALSSDDYFLAELLSPKSPPESPSPINTISKNSPQNIAIEPTIYSIIKDFLKLNFTFYVITGVILALSGIILLTLINMYPAMIAAAFTPAFSIIGIQILSGLLIALGGYLCFNNNSNSPGTSF